MKEFKHTVVFWFCSTWMWGVCLAPLFLLYYHYEPGVRFMRQNNLSFTGIIGTCIVVGIVTLVIFGMLIDMSNEGEKEDE